MITPLITQASVLDVLFHTRRHNVLLLYSALPILFLAVSCGASASDSNQPGTSVTQGTLPDQTAKPLAPGTAWVAASIMSIDSLETQLKITLHIGKVTGYGAATPVIIPQSIITARMRHGVNFLMPSDEREVKILLRHIPPGRGEYFNGGVWQIIWIEPND